MLVLSFGIGGAGLSDNEWELLHFGNGWVGTPAVLCKITTGFG